MKRMSFASAMRWGMLALFVCLLAGSTASAGVLFSYDAAGGQLPSDQGWAAYKVDTDGPLTAPNTVGTEADNSNVAIENVAGVGNVLHIRDTLPTPMELPTYYFQWTPTQQERLIEYGLKFTMTFKGLRTANGGKGNVRFDFSGSEFQNYGFTNIGANQAFQINGMSSELAPLDDDYHTLEVIGQKVGTPGNEQFAFSGTFDGAPISNYLTGSGFAVVNSPNANLANSLYFGASSSGNTGADFLVKSVVVETLNVPEPAALTLVACGALAVVCRGRSRKPI
jgi:hypothetical protein